MKKKVFFVFPDPTDEDSFEEEQREKGVAKGATPWQSTSQCAGEKGAGEKGAGEGVECVPVRDLIVWGRV